jgi:DNA-directed RNA polymerase, mitochondrial
MPGFFLLCEDKTKTVNAGNKRGSPSPDKRAEPLPSHYETTEEKLLNKEETPQRSVEDILPPDPIETLFARQMAFEARAIDSGVKRFRESIARNAEKHQESVSFAGQRLLKESLEPAASALQAFIDASQGKVGRQHLAVRIIRELGAYETAYLTGKCILDHVSVKVPASKLVLKIAGYLLDELRYRKFQSHRPECGEVERLLDNGKTTKCVEGCAAGLFAWKMQMFNTSSYSHMKRSLDASMYFTKIDVSDYDFSEPHRMLIGTKCLDIFQEATHYVEVQRVTLRNKRQTYVVATDATLEWIKRCNGALQFTTPVFLPTLTPPRPWSNTRDGGYWFSLARRCTLMRTDGRHQLQDLDNVEMPKVYEAINALQETSWLINEPVLNVIDTMKNWGNAAAGLPSYEDEPLPKRPEDIETNLPARKTWRKAAHLIHERNHVRRGHALKLAKTLSTARLLLRERDDSTGLPLPFYFPHSMDFRGRTYPIPLYLSPQGNDVEKGLLKFGEGKALGSQEAADWLAIHGANCLADAPTGEKLDKLPFTDRVRWIEEHTDIILDVAADPLSNDWWTLADSPFCFLAFCFEWAGYKREGLSFVSYIPVAMDGSCNGLQHYSALLRDEKGGAEVNLVPSEKPQDIYRSVAKQVVSILEAYADSDSSSDKQKLALAWLTWGKIDRKFVKRQVMTLPYGSSQYGFRVQVEEYIDSLDRHKRPSFTLAAENGDDEDNLKFKAYIFISNVIWEALQSTTESACTTMEFFRKLAKLCTLTDVPIVWTTPAGLPVVQSYRKDKLSKTIHTMLAGKIFSPGSYSKAKAIDNKKQVSGIAPNMIHSLDAAAMMLTVSTASQTAGIHHFAFIHDSYGTHAADTSTLARVTREEFVKMYSSGNVLENIAAEMTSDLDLTTIPPEDIPSIPPMGSLDVASVLQSQYFFA